MNISCDVYSYALPFAGDVLSDKGEYLRGVIYTPIPWLAIGTAVFCAVSLLWIALVCFKKLDLNGARVCDIVCL